MPIGSIIAIYFVVWWIVLFAVLPWGVRTQEEEGEVVLGTDPSAPANPRSVAQGDGDVHRRRDRHVLIWMLFGHYGVGVKEIADWLDGRPTIKKARPCGLASTVPRLNPSCRTETRLAGRVFLRVLRQQPIGAPEGIFLPRLRPRCLFIGKGSWPFLPAGSIHSLFKNPIESRTACHQFVRRRPKFLHWTAQLKQNCLRRFSPVRRQPARKFRRPAPVAP